MKRLYFLLVLMCLPCMSWAQVYNQEVRGVWITNVDSDVMFTKEKLAKAMDYLAANGFNVVYPVVWNKGYTLFPSTTLFTAVGTSQDPYFEAQRRDPLQEIIVEAHRVGIEVIPWFEFGFSPAYSNDGGYIIKAKPHWASRTSNNFLVVKNGFSWMNAFHPEVQEFMWGMMEESLQNYDVDGVQGDDRLPAMPVEGGYDDYTKALYKKERGVDPPTFSGDAAWIQWRANKLTSFLGRVYNRTKAIDKNFIVSMSPSIYNFSLNNYLQDWPRWIDSSYVDIVHPQAYRYEVASYQALIREMVGGTPQSAGGYIRATNKHKLSAGVLTKAGSTLIPPKMILEEVRYHRQFGLNGEVFFFYEGMGSKNQFLADSLKKYIYKKPAIMPTRKGLWRPSATIVNETDASVVKTGTWTTETAINGYQGNMLYAAPGSNATITYTLTAPYSGTYDVFAFDPRSHIEATTKAEFTVKAATATQTVTIDQKSAYTTGWERLNTVKLNAGESVTITLKADVLNGGKVFADGVMLLLNRKATPNLQIPVSITTANEAESDPIPQRISLEQNFPNPFSEFSEVHFSLEQTASVKLKVFDLLGRNVQTVFDDVKPAGNHAVKIEAKHLPNGVYFYQLETPQQTLSKKMVVLK